MTYEAMRQHQAILLSVKWGVAVLDEGHKIRNPDAAISVAVKQLRTSNRIILSGTPIQNQLRELWSLFDFVYPGRLGSRAAFETEFEQPIRAGGWSNAGALRVQTAYECAVGLRDLIRPYFLRRMKSEVNALLPEKTDQVLFCHLTPQQLRMYKAFLQSREVMDVLAGKRAAFR